MIFDTAISGLQAATSNLDVIGNNIANSSTIGFKGSRADFADVYAYGSGTGSTTIGGGVLLSQVQQSFKSGGLVNTNNTLDLAVNGSGFFVLNNQGATSYTRAGQFKLDEQSFITNASGGHLTGLLADANGNITGASGNLSVNQANLSPKATTLVNAGYNLDSRLAAKSADWVGGASPANDTFNNTNSITVYDSLGNSHILNMFFIKSDSNAAASDPNASSPPGTTNQWYVAFQIDNQDVPPVGATGNTNNLFRANFNPDGTFAGVLDTTNTPLANNLIPISYNPTSGANPLNFNLDLSSCSQFASGFAPTEVISDGYTTGILSNLSINGAGVISGVYTNGKSLAMGQIQLANFADPTGLQNIGNVSWVATATSGQPLMGAPGTGSLGGINSGMIEGSNVDLTSELVNLIGAQRDFQANAQSIRAGDTITQTIINMR